MRALARLLLAASLALLAASSAWALEVPRLDRRVTDLAGVLGPDGARALEQRLAAYEQRTGHQFAVLTVPSLEGDPIEDFSIRVAERWKLGDRKRDDGLLVVLALRERRVRIEVGYGLEGVVTDAVSSRVIAEQMAPRFRRGDYAGGLVAALEVLMAAAEGEAVGRPRAPSGAPRPSGYGWIVPVLFILLIMLLSRGGRGGRRRRGIWFMPPIGFGGGWSSGSRRGGGWSGGGGGWSGGGGRFGGGGASGGW